MHKTLVDCETLSRYVGEPDWVVVDCRCDLMKPAAGHEAYLQGHIPGALYADLNKDLSAPLTAASGRHPLPEPARFAQQLAQWGIRNTSQVVVYDAGNGAYAVRLWWMLRWLGHPAVALLDGGLAAWQAAGFDLTQAIPPPIVGRFEFTPDDSAHITMAEVRQGVLDRAICLVDARAAARYAGEVEPIDPVAGHIPTALNYPFEANLDNTGRFLAAELLRMRFATLAGQPERVVHMCGSGVTACHNILAMDIAGLSGSKLYAGSWSEWVRDPKNPVIRGNEA